MVKDLRPNSDKLPRIQDLFSAYRREYKIEVLSCWETIPFEGHIVNTMHLDIAIIANLV